MLTVDQKQERVDDSERCSELFQRSKIVHCATRKKKIYFASAKFDARAKRGQQPHE